MDYLERIASDLGLRLLLQATRGQRPTEVMGTPVVTVYKLNAAGQVVRSERAGWSQEDRDWVMALDAYEASLCPGGNHVLAETSRPEHEDAYRPGERTRCYYCKAVAMVNDVESKNEDSAGVLTSLVLDAEVVRRNQLPVPPLPPELAAL